MPIPMLPGAAPKRRVSPKNRLRQELPWLPYAAPFVIFLVLTAFEGQAVDLYPFFYSLKIVVVTWTLWSLRRFLPELRWQRRGLALAVGMGVALTVIWFGVDRYTPHLALLGGRVAYDPIARIPNVGLRTLFLAIRFFGLVIVTPIVEELFYRGFLLRYVSDPDNFKRVAIGRFTATAFAVNILFMALSHPEWLAAAIFSAAMCALIARTRSLTACIVAHGVTNLLLGIFVMLTHNWQYW